MVRLFMMELVKLEPIYKSYIWGGDYFIKHGKNFGVYSISELWELSARDNDSSIITTGPNRGKKLADVLTREDIGPVYDRFNRFPLLIKLIDANDRLSIQVHPSDEYALRHENSLGKTESWIIIDADEGAGLYLGFKETLTKDEIRKHLADNTITDYLNFVPVKKGDSFLINAGTVHAIGKGVRLIEIQENSDLTYRFYDYNRIGKDGKPRELHIEKALEVVDTKKYIISPSFSGIHIDSTHFEVVGKTIEKELVIEPDKDSFISFTFISGSGEVNNIPYKQFDTFFLPHGKSCKIIGNGEAIISRAKL